jgi:hypothetical protein
MRTLQIDCVAVLMDENLSRGTMHHQRDKEVSEMLWKVVGCCRFGRLIMAWTSIAHARKFLVQTSHDPNQCCGPCNNHRRH